MRKFVLHSRLAGIGSLGLPRLHLDLRPLPAGAFVAFPTVRTCMSRSSRRRHLLDLGRASRALASSRNASRHPKMPCAPASWDSRCVRPSIVSPHPCPLPARDESRAIGPAVPTAGIPFRPRGSSPPRRLSPPDAFVGLLHPTSDPEVRRVSGFPLPPPRFRSRESLAADGVTVAVPPTLTPLEESPSPAAVPCHHGLCLLAVTARAPTRWAVAWP